jgi:hypothetical protein
MKTKDRECYVARWSPALPTARATARAGPIEPEPAIPAPFGYGPFAAIAMAGSHFLSMPCRKGKSFSPLEHRFCPDAAEIQNGPFPWIRILKDFAATITLANYLQALLRFRRAPRGPLAAAGSYRLN